jgi:hypothetical protein
MTIAPEVHQTGVTGCFLERESSLSTSLGDRVLSGGAAALVPRCGDFPFRPHGAAAFGPLIDACGD